MLLLLTVMVAVTATLYFGICLGLLRHYSKRERFYLETLAVHNRFVSMYNESCLDQQETEARLNEVREEMLRDADDYNETTKPVDPQAEQGLDEMMKDDEELSDIMDDKVPESEYGSRVDVFHGDPYCIKCNSRMTSTGSAAPVNQQGTLSYMVVYSCSKCGTVNTLVSGTRNTTGEHKHYTFWRTDTGQ